MAGRSNIIERLNERHGTEFSESERLAVEQISATLKANEELKVKAQVNTYEVFRHTFEPTFLDSAIKECGNNQTFFGKIPQDENSGAA